jgi:hypothetical protein
LPTRPSNTAKKSKAISVIREQAVVVEVGPNSASWPGYAKAGVSSSAILRPFRFQELSRPAQFIQAVDPLLDRQLVNEINRDEVTQDLITWLDGVVAGVRCSVSHSSTADGLERRWA